MSVLFGDTVELSIAEVDESAIKNAFGEPTKLYFNASRLEDVVFTIGVDEFNIDFRALVRDYGKAVDHEQG